MLSLNPIGIWEELIPSRLTQTRFVPQDREDSFVILLQESALPAFTTNLSLKQKNRKQNRTVIPILNPEAKITFYCSVCSSNSHYLPTQ